MNTTYLIWKDPFCGGLNPEWQEISGREFYALVCLPENKGRCFVKLEGADEGDATIVMEATKASYTEWRKEKDHTDLVREGMWKKGYSTISYHALNTENDDCNGEELIEDENASVETEYLMSMELGLPDEALSRLTEDEYGLIAFLFLADNKRTDQEYADISGIPRRTVTYRKMVVLNKIKKYLTS